MPLKVDVLSKLFTKIKAKVLL